MQSQSQRAELAARIVPHAPPVLIDRP